LNGAHKLLVSADDVNMLGKRINTANGNTEVKKDVGLEANAEKKEAYEGVPKSFRTGPLERELQKMQLSASKCSCIAIL
jgi:hypothetical protein